MARLAAAPGRADDKTLIDRALSLFTDVRAGEGATATLMLVNIFLLLICYSVIKTVREPLILLGGGATVRSYAAAGQALLLMGFVPLYSWFASRVDRVKLLVGVSLFFVVNIELFAVAVAAGTPFVGVAFFIWVGIFSVSLIAQFWSYANDIYTKDMGERLFPLIAIGMTAGAPLGSLAASWLFGGGYSPQQILQLSAFLLTINLGLYLLINGRETRRAAKPAAPLSGGGGFALVLSNPYLRLIAVLIVLLNIVNTTGEYLVARLVSGQADAMAAGQAGFDKQAYIGAFYGNYQFWVNIVAFIIQAFVTSRLVKYFGLRGALLALPLIALGGYAFIAAGAGIAVVRWVKTAENATDYSVMNTARQLLWLPTTPDEKYKAKQAVDTFFVRGGDVISAGVVYLGTQIMQLSISGFAAGNVVLTLVWLGVAVLILRRSPARTRAAQAAIVALAVGVSIASLPNEASAQQTRAEQHAAAQAEKAKNLRPYEPNLIERRLERVQGFLTSQPKFYPFIGSIYRGGFLAAGPGFRSPFADTGFFDAHAAWSLRNYKGVDVFLKTPDFPGGRGNATFTANWLDAPSVAFYGTGNSTATADKVSFLYRNTRAGASAQFRPVRVIGVGGGLEYLDIRTGSGRTGTSIEERFNIFNTAGLGANPTYLRSHAFAEVDWRTSPGYTRRGGLYRVDWSNFDETESQPYTFRRFDVELQQFVPIMRENWVLAFRGALSRTMTDAGQIVPFFMMPDLGGSSDLRGYPSWRFRDRNRILLTGEYRWMAGNFVDMALFVDAGKVEPRWRDIDFEDLRKSYGIGVRFHTPLATVLRIELARTNEGTGLVFAFGRGF